MSTPSVGFIGGGRVARILLGGWSRAGVLPPEVLVSDSDAGVLDHLANRHPSIRRLAAGDSTVARQDVVFLALHPPAIAGALRAFRGVVPPKTVLVSLAPKFRIARLAEMLGGFRRVARVIPNAPSIVNAGFNPVAFRTELPPQDRERVLALLKPLGQSPVVEESKLEAYAILSGMGPTYLWPQMVELETLAVRFGLSEPEARRALREMMLGTVETLHRSGLEPREVEDLIPVKPLADVMPSLQEAYRTRLTALMEKIRPQ